MKHAPRRPARHLAGGARTPGAPIPGTMAAYAAEFDERVARQDVRDVRLADKHRVARMPRVLPRTTRRPLSQGSGAWARLDSLYQED